MAKQILHDPVAKEQPDWSLHGILPPQGDCTMIGKTGKRGDLQIASMGNLVKLGDFLRNIAMFYILKKQLGF